MKIAAIAILSLLLIVLGVKIYSFVAEENQMSQELSDVQTRLTKAQTDEESLQEESQYLANPINLEKELRARFNYKKPGETMIIIVPAQSSTASSTE
jgi:cell division protein FtsB